MVRIPDVTIVRNPALPPTRDNMSTIVEMKFASDRLGPGQLRDYQRIIGDPSRVVVLEESDCGCGDDQQEQEQPAGAPNPWAAILLLLAIAAIIATDGAAAPVVLAM